MEATNEQVLEQVAFLPSYIYSNIIDNLINDGLLKPESKAYNDFRETRLKTDEERLIYINRVINKGFDFDGEIRVKYGNIHEVKGLTFDNVIVDETITRDEAFFVQRRLKYTAYSRGIFDYWTLRSNTNKQLGGINGSI